MCRDVRYKSYKKYLENMMERQEHVPLNQRKMNYNILFSKTVNRILLKA